LIAYDLKYSNTKVATVSSFECKIKTGIAEQCSNYQGNLNDFYKNQSELYDIIN